MKLKIFGEPEVDDTVRLRLVDVGYGGVTLRAVDKAGKLVPGGDLLTISEEGITRHYSVVLSLGFALQEPTGQIKVFD